MNHVKVISLIKEEGKVVGVRVQDTFTKEEWDIRGKYLSFLFFFFLSLFFLPFLSSSFFDLSLFFSHITFLGELSQLWDLLPTPFAKWTTLRFKLYLFSFLSYFSFHCLIYFFLFLTSSPFLSPQDCRPLNRRSCGSPKLLWPQQHGSS